MSLPLTKPCPSFHATITLVPIEAIISSDCTALLASLEGLLQRTVEGIANVLVAEARGVRDAVAARSSSGTRFSSVSGALRARAPCGPAFGCFFNHLRHACSARTSAM